MITASTTLHDQGMTRVATAAQAASALRPAAGELAYARFAVCILATGGLAVTVLAGGIGYALGEALGWRRGLGQGAREAWRFYATIVGCIVLAELLNFVSIHPMRALVLSRVLNGLVAIPLINLVLRISNEPRIMGRHTNGRLADTLGWTAFLDVTAVGVAAIRGVARGT